jgi:hypothetical protein
MSSPDVVPILDTIVPGFGYTIQELFSWEEVEVKSLRPVGQIEKRGFANFGQKKHLYIRQLQLGQFGLFSQSVRYLGLGNCPWGQALPYHFFSSTTAPRRASSVPTLEPLVLDYCTFFCALKGRREGDDSE